MAIQIRFDAERNPIPPTLVLATRSGRKLGAIPATNIRFQDNMNAASEVSFTVYKSDDNNSNTIWDEITNLRLVWCKEWDAWFEIEVDVSETDALMKTINGTSLAEAELSQINLYDIEINTEDDVEDYVSLHPDDDYIPTVFYDPVNTERSLLHRLLQKAPHYSVGFVDQTLADKQRTFSFDNTSIYDALQDIAEELKCLFILDSSSNSGGVPKRTVNAYTIDNYGYDTNIFVSTANLTDEIQMQTDVREIKNCFKLQAGDDVMNAALRACNPNGSDYVWFFSDDVKADMSTALSTALENYEVDHDTIDHTDFNQRRIVKTSEGYSVINGGVLTSADKQKLLPKPQTDPPTVIDLNCYSGLVNTQYRAMDKIDELTHTMSPGIDTTKPTIDHEQSAVNAAFAGDSGFVAVTDVSQASQTTVSSALKSRARAIVDSRYDVKVSDVQYTAGGTTGSGKVTISEYGDSSIYRESTVSFSVTSDIEKYIKQNIDIVLNKREQVKDAYDIPAVAKMPYDTTEEKAAFDEKLEMYSLKRLESLYDALRACMDIMIEQNVASGTWNEEIKSDLYDPYLEKLYRTESEITNRQEAIDDVEGVLKKIADQISIINEILNLEKYLGSALYLELSAYRRDETYQNDNYISDGLTDAEIVENARLFYDAAIEECGKAAYGTHTISAKLANLLVIKEFESITDAFEVGNYIRIQIDGNVFKLRLLQYEIDYDNLGLLNVEFSDYNALRDGTTELASILKNATNMSSSFSYVARQADQGKKANDKLVETTQIGLDLTKTRIVDNPDNQCITMDENGVLCRRKDPATGNYDAKQIKILNNGMYATADNWNTVSAAFGEIFYRHPTQGTKNGYGVIAKALVGDELILGDVFAYHGALFYIKLENVNDNDRKYHITCLNGSVVPEEHRHVFHDENNPESDSIYGTLMRVKESSTGIGFIDAINSILPLIERLVKSAIESVVYPAFCTDYYSAVIGGEEGVMQYVAVRHGRVYTSDGFVRMDLTSFVDMVIRDDDAEESERTVIATDDDIAGQTINGFGFSPLPTEIIEGVDPAAGQLSGCHIIATTGDENTISGTITFDNFVCGGSDMVGASVSLIYLTSSDYHVTSGTFAIEFDGGVIEYGSAIDIGGSVTLNWELSSAMAGYSGSAILSLDLNYTQQ